MKLIDALNELETKIKKGKKHYLFDCGICENVATIAKKYHTCEIKSLCESWKHFSGDLIYPIGNVEQYNHHKLNETLWIGEQLKLRLDLIKHMKGKLT